MNFEEHVAKPILREIGISIPTGAVASTPESAIEVANEVGPCVIKAQVPTGKRGKAGGIKVALTADDAGVLTKSILGMKIDGHLVEKVLVESQVTIHKEFYIAILNDSKIQAPLLLFSKHGGMDVEDSNEESPNQMIQHPIDIISGFSAAEIRKELSKLELGQHLEELIEISEKLYQVYRKYDAELIEINPLAVTPDGLIALDCKLVLDDSSSPRQQDLAKNASDELLTELEISAQNAGLKYIELGGSVGVLANGAGLTMTTMDAISYYGGEPANFLEIGGEAYTKSQIALEILLSNPRIKSLLVNFCGAFARTDVMAEGVVNAWKNLNPDIPIFFTIHGTGEEEAIELVTKELGIEPYDLMDDAVKAAVNASK